MSKSEARKDMSPSDLIDGRIKELGDWRGEMLSRLRTLIKQAIPEVVEEWKWRGVPVWYQDGMICTGETYKSVVKLTFANGAALEDPSKLFNSSLEGNVRRAIDIHEGDKVNERAPKISSEPQLIQSEQVEEESACGDAGESKRNQKDMTRSRGQPSLP